MDKRRAGNMTRLVHLFTLGGFVRIDIARIKNAQVVIVQMLSQPIDADKDLAIGSTWHNNVPSLKQGSLYRCTIIRIIRLFRRAQQV